MSWIIGQYIRDLPYIIEKGAIDSDDFNNCLMLQRCIGNMDSHGLLSDFEKDILIGMVEGYNYTELAKILNYDRETISRTFKNLTDRIAYLLGGEFTDASFIDRIEARGQLEEVDIDDLFKRGIIKDDY